MPEDYREQPSVAESMALWAVAGYEGQTPPVDVRPDQVAAVVKLADAHAVVSRMTRRYSQLRQGQQPAVASALAHAKERLVRVAHGHVAAVRELAGLLGPTSDIVLVKGLTAHLLTGQPEALRVGDIDLVCSSDAGQAIIATLTSLDYSRTRDPFMYEIGEFTRTAGDAEPVEIDLHSYYPVNSYDAALGTADLSPRAEQRTWTQSGQLEVRRLTTSELRLGQPSPHKAEIESVLPHPVAAALVLCSHGFLNYTNLWSISHRGKPYVRLGELADIAALTSHPRFDPGLFEGLAKSVNGEWCVRWASWACQRLLGYDPFTRAGIRVGDAATFPRCLWWDLWADIPGATPSWLTTDWLRMNQIVTELGATGHPVPAAGIRVLPARPSPEVRVVTNSPGPLPECWSVELRVADDQLRVRVEFGDRPAQIQRMRVDMGNVATEWERRRGASKSTTTGYPALLITDEWTRVEMAYPRSCLVPESGEPTSIALLVGMATAAQDQRQITALLAMKLIIDARSSSRYQPIQGGTERAADRDAP